MPEAVLFRVSREALSLRICFAGHPGEIELPGRVGNSISPGCPAKQIRKDSASRLTRNNTASGTDQHQLPPGSIRGKSGCHGADLTRLGLQRVIV